MNGTVVTVGGVPSGWRPTAARARTHAASRPSAYHIARRWLISTGSVPARWSICPTEHLIVVLAHLLDDRAARDEGEGLLGLQGQGRRGGPREVVPIDDAPAVEP